MHHQHLPQQVQQLRPGGGQALHELLDGSIRAAASCQLFTQLLLLQQQGGVGCSRVPGMLLLVVVLGQLLWQPAPQQQPQQGQAQIKHVGQTGGGLQAFLAMLPDKAFPTVAGAVKEGLYRKVGSPYPCAAPPIIQAACTMVNDARQEESGIPRLQHHRLGANIAQA